MQFDTEQSTEALRNKENYKSDLQLNNFKETGVKNSCLFERLPGFSVTDNITFDIMHDIFEGVCQYDLCNVLQSLINDNVISLSTINSRKSLFQFGEIEIGNIFGDLEPYRLNFNLSMSASESMCFVHFLSFIIGDLIPVNNKHWLVFTSLLKISDVILKPSFSEEDLSDLKLLIKKHHTMYTKLYGALKPKHHLLLHYATAIRKCGSLRNLW